MKLNLWARWMGGGVMGLSLGLWVLASQPGVAQDRTTRSGEIAPGNRTANPGGGTARPADGQASILNPVMPGLSLSEGIAHENLTVYFISGGNFQDTSKVITLDEALEKKLIKVHETGNVSELAVENLSKDLTIFVQAGDIVKGGKQDRVISTDLPLRPKSGRTPIAAFCVEHGRWTVRGQESVAEFNSSKNTVSDKNLKIAVRKEKDQSRVWANVQEVQGKLNASSGTSVNASASPSSMQLSLENKDIKKLSKPYLDKLRPLGAGQKNALGFVYVINGEINSAEIYASRDLFGKFWVKALESAVLEAVGELKGKSKNKVLRRDEVETLLIEAEKAPASAELIFEDLWNVTAEGKGSLVFATVEKAKKDEWMRRSFLWK